MEKCFQGFVKPEEMEKELLNSIEYDEKRKRENDAKIRAMEQGVPTYEHFRQIVLGCHLQPLEKKDKEPMSHLKIWNTTLNLGGSKGQEENAAGEDDSGGTQTEKMPTTASEFHRAWKSMEGKPEGRMALLKEASKRGRLKAFLQSDYIHLISRELFQALSIFDDRNMDDVKLVFDVISMLVEGPHFKFICHFLTRDERDILTKLFEKLRLATNGETVTLQESSLHSDTLDMLMKKYLG